MARATEHQREVLSTAYDALVRAELAMEADLTRETARAFVRSESVLLDACVDCGMSRDEPDHVEWAAALIAAWLTSAPFRSLNAVFGAA